MATEFGAPGQEPDTAKLKELVIFIASRSDADAHFGKTKLNKILFYSDFMHYARHGKSITGFAYLRMPYGPCPENFPSVLDEMAKDETLRIAERRHFTQMQQRPVALREANLDALSGSEIAAIQEVIDALRNESAVSVSELSHEFIGWKLATPFERIPYSVATIQQQIELSTEDAKYADELRETIRAGGVTRGTEKSCTLAGMRPT